MIIPADKKNNFYKVSKEDYNGLLQKHITKDYRKTDEKAFDDNTEKDKEIAVDLELDDRIYKTAKKQAFITLKDHKPTFRNNPTCRLLNPTKPEIGKISKQILRKIVKIVRENSQLKQWENTDKVIEWFTNIQNKQSLTFIVFDICDFYPSISPELLKKSLNYAKTYTNISDQDIKIILQARKSFLFDKNTPWNKTKNPDLDVGMGSFDGAECCDLFGLYLLSKLRPLNINLGLYRDDGLGVLQMTSRQAELTKRGPLSIPEVNFFQPVDSG